MATNPNTSVNIPVKDSVDHILFDELQQRFSRKFYDIILDDMAQKTIVIIPSLTLDQEVLKTVKGAIHYEERMLCLLLLL